MSTFARCDRCAPSPAASSNRAGLARGRAAGLPQDSTNARVGTGRDETALAMLVIVEWIYLSTGPTTSGSPELTAFSAELQKATGHAALPYEVTAYDNLMLAVAAIGEGRQHRWDQNA